MTKQTQKPLISVKSVSKKFCRSIHDSMKYGIIDIINIFIGRKPTVELRKEEFWSLKDIELEVYRGECLGIIGANGSGKSTLMKIVSGIFPPDRGDVITNGKVCSLLEVGSGFHPQLTGRENIFIKGTILGLTKKELIEKYDSILEFSGLEENIDMPVKSYSSGMHSRLGFAIAAHVEPDILLLDEVLAVGDFEFRSKCLNYVSSIKKKTAVVFISHDMKSVARLCDKAICLEKGRAIYSGETNKAISMYRSGVSEKTDVRISERNKLVTEEISSVSASAVNSVQQFEDLFIHLKLAINTISNFHIIIGIGKANGIHCFGIMSDCITVEKSGEFNITLQLEKLHLMPGKYVINIQVLDEKKIGRYYISRDIHSFIVFGEEETDGIYAQPHRWVRN